MTFAQPLDVEQQEGKDTLDDATAQRLQRWQIANVLALVGNMIAVSIPGRLDGNSGGVGTVEGSLNYATPAGAAFAIWGAIYATEVVFVIWQALQRNDEKIPFVGKAEPRRLQLILAASPFWVAANIAQILWCATYRPYLSTFGTMWISALFLSLTAFFLNFVHAVFAETQGCAEQLIMNTPINMHFGWTTAAALVNWNNWYSKSSPGPAGRVVLLSFSLALAAVIGCGLSLRRRSGGYACAIAWAVFWVGIRTLNSDEIAKELGGSNAELLAAVELAIAAGMLTFGLGMKAVFLYRGEQ